MKLGRLKEVDVRELWKHEQYDFSPWLAQDANIELLNDILGLTLVDVESEVYVGAYKCDLVAKDEATDIKVIIENQLECSDHNHLGKIITYASGLNATVIVWIVTEARDEHRSAIEWLNNHTNKDLNFFLIELHAYKIGDSLPAPMFKVLESPNDFIKGNNDPKDMNKSGWERLNFWTRFNEMIAAKGKPFNIRKARASTYYDITIGTSKAYLFVALVNKEGVLRVVLCILNNHDLFDTLYEQRHEIEGELGFDFDWQRKDSSKRSSIVHEIPGLNFDDHSNYNELMEEIIEKVSKMKSVFSSYIAKNE